MSGQLNRGGDRGAIIIHVAFALMGLLAFSAVVIDQGVLLVARRQAQTAADAGALAGAISLMNDFDDYTGADAAAKHYAGTNAVWGQATAVSNIVVSPLPYTCPAGIGAGEPACIRVDVLRGMPDRADAPHTNVLPMYFGSIFGVGTQGTRATATAIVGQGNFVQCIKPWIVADKWTDTSGTGLDLTGWDQMDYYDRTTDVYTKPGFRATGENNDYGLQLMLKGASETDWSSGWSLEIDFGEGNGSNLYRQEIAGCPEWVPDVGLYDESIECSDRVHTNEEKGCVNVRTGVRQGPTRDGVGDLVGLDPTASWNPATNSVQNSCAEDDSCTSPNPLGTDLSPRIVPLAIFNPQAYWDSSCQGNNCVGQVVNLLGFFVEGMCSNVYPGNTAPEWCGKHPSQTVVGRLVNYPGQANGVAGAAGPETFIKVVRLIR